MRYVPETPEQRAEYPRRVKFADSHAEKFPYERRGEVAKKLRKYRSDDLKDTDIRANAEEEIIRARGRLVAGYYDPKDKSVHVLGRDPYALDHEMAHYLTDKKFGTIRPAKYSKFLTEKYKLEIATYLGDYVVTDEAEVIAEAFELMRLNPDMARWFMRKSPEMRELFKEVMNDLDYGISGVKRIR